MRTVASPEAVAIAILNSSPEACWHKGDFSSRTESAASFCAHTLNCFRNSPKHSLAALVGGFNAESVHSIWASAGGEDKKSLTCCRIGSIFSSDCSRLPIVRWTRPSQSSGTGAGTRTESAAVTSVAGLHVPTNPAGGALGMVMPHVRVSDLGEMGRQRRRH